MIKSAITPVLLALSLSLLTLFTRFTLVDSAVLPSSSSSGTLYSRLSYSNSHATVYGPHASERGAIAKRAALDARQFDLIGAILFGNPGSAAKQEEQTAGPSQTTPTSTTPDQASAASAAAASAAQLQEEEDEVPIDD